MKKKIASSLVATAFASGLVFYPSVSMAAQIATDPGDYNPLPAGTDLGIVYYQHTTHEKFYSSGDDISDAAGIKELNTDIGLLRWVHYIDLGGYIVDPQIIIPFGEVSLKTNEETARSSGVGDPIIGGTLWLYNNVESRQAFGVTMLASIPLGEYEADKGPVNIGENRWKLITQAGYVTPLTDTVSLDVIGEYTFFGDNDDFASAKKEQDDQYGVQIHLSKSLGEATKATLSYYRDFGGETSLNGVGVNDELDNSRWQGTLSHFVAPDIQVQFQYGRSIDVKNGFFEEDRFNFRLVKVF